MKALDCVPERWTVLLLQNVWTYFDEVIRTDADEEPVEGRMV